MRYLAFFVVNPNISHHEDRLEDNILCYYPHDTPINTQLYDVGFTTALLKLHERFQDLPDDSNEGKPSSGSGAAGTSKQAEEPPHERGLPKPLCVTLATKRYVLLSIDVDCYLGVVVQREIYIPRSRRGFLSFPNSGTGTLNDVDYALENEEEEDALRRDAAVGHAKGGKNRQEANSKSKHTPHRRRRLSGCWNATASNPLYDDEDDFSVDVISTIVRDVYGAFCFHLGGVMHLYNRFQSFVKSAYHESESAREEKLRSRERFARQRKVELSISSRDGASNTLLPQVYKPNNFSSTGSLGSARTTITRQQCCECGYETMHIGCNNKNTNSDRSLQTSLVSSTSASMTNDARVLLHDSTSKRTPLSTSHSSLPSSVVEEGSYRGPSSIGSLSDPDSARNGMDMGNSALLSHDKVGVESTSNENRGFMRHLRESVTLKELHADDEDDASTDDCILIEQEFLHGAELRLQCRRSPNSSSTEPITSSTAAPSSLDAPRDILKSHQGGGQVEHDRKNSSITTGDWDDSARTDTTHSREGNPKEVVLGAKELARRLEKRGRSYIREVLRSHLLYPLRLALDRSCSHESSTRDLEGTFLATDGLNVATVNSFGGDVGVSALIHAALQTFVGRLMTAFPGALMECVVVIKERKQVALSTLSVQRTKQFMRLVSGEAPWAQIIVPTSSSLPIWEPMATKTYEEVNDTADDGAANDTGSLIGGDAFGERSESTNTLEQNGIGRNSSLSDRNLVERRSGALEQSPAPWPTYRGNFCGSPGGTQGRSPFGTPDVSPCSPPDDEKLPEDKLINLGSSKNSALCRSKNSRSGTLPIPLPSSSKNARMDGGVHSGGDVAEGTGGGNSVASRDEAFVSPLTLDRGNNSLARQGRTLMRLPSGRTASWNDSGAFDRRRRSPCSPSDRDSESYGASPSSPSSRVMRANDQGERCVRCGGRLVVVQHQFVSVGRRSVMGISALRASLASPISKLRSSKVLRSPKKADRSSFRRSTTVGDALRHAIIKVKGLLLNVNEQTRGIAFPQELGGGFTAWLVVNDLYAAVPPLWDGFLQELVEAVTQWKTQVDLLDHPPTLTRGGALVGGGAAIAAANGRKSATSSSLGPGESRLLSGLSTVSPGFLQSLFPAFSKPGSGGTSGESQGSQEKHGGFGLLQSMVPGTGFISKLLSNGNDLRGGGGGGQTGGIPFYLIAASQESYEAVPLSSALLPTETEVQAALLAPLTSAQWTALKLQCLRSLKTPPSVNMFPQPSVFSVTRHHAKPSTELSSSSKKRKFLFWTFGDNKTNEHNTDVSVRTSPKKRASSEEVKLPAEAQEADISQTQEMQPSVDSTKTDGPIITAVPSGALLSSPPLYTAVQFDGLENAQGFAADAWVAPVRDGSFLPRSPTTRTTPQPKLSASTVEQQKGTVIFHYRNEFIGQEKTSFGPRVQLPAPAAAPAEVAAVPAAVAGTGGRRSERLKLSSDDGSESESRTSGSVRRSTLTSVKTSSTSLGSDMDNDTDTTATFTGSDSTSIRGDRNGQSTIRQADREAMHQLDILRHSVFSTFFSVSLRPSCHDEDGSDESGAFARDTRERSGTLWSLPNSGYDGACDMEGSDSLLRGELEVWLQLHPDTWLSLKKVGLRTFSCVVSECKSFRDAEESVVKCSRIVFSNAMQILGDASDDEYE